MTELGPDPRLRAGPSTDVEGPSLSYLEHAVEQAQEAGGLDPNTSAREISFQLDAFAQASNARY